MLGADLVERSPDALVIVAPPVKAMRVPVGARTSASARRRAARNSRLSIIEAVRVR
jgi:hypothetical protein